MATPAEAADHAVATMRLPRDWKARCSAAQLIEVGNRRSLPGTGASGKDWAQPLCQTICPTRPLGWYRADRLHPSESRRNQESLGGRS